MSVGYWLLLRLLLVMSYGRFCVIEKGMVNFNCLVWWFVFGYDDLVILGMSVMVLLWLLWVMFLCL